MALRTDLLQNTGDRRGQANAWHSLGYAHHHLGHHAWSRAWDILDTLGHPDAARVNAKLSAAHPAATAP